LTVDEILKAVGATDEEIKNAPAWAKAAVAKSLTESETTLTAARAAQEAAELAKRAQETMYQTEIVPALDRWSNDWSNEKAALEAERDFYKNQNANAKTAGFIPKDAPVFGTPKGPDARDPKTGTFIPNANPVPGSPAITDQNVDRIISTLTDVPAFYNDYHALYGQPFQGDIKQLLEEARIQRVAPNEYLSRKFDFAKKRQEATDAAQKKRDDKLVADALEKNNKEWAEKTGSNGNLRPAQPSAYSKINKAVESKQRHNPIMMSDEQRRLATRQRIHQEIAEKEAGVGA